MSYPGAGPVRLAITALFFVNGMAAASWFVRIPAVKSGLGISAGELSLALLSVASGSILTMLAASRLVERFGASGVLMGGAPLLCLGLSLPALAPSLLTLCLAGLVLGTGNGLMNVSLNSRASDLEKEYGRPIMPSFHALFSLGGFAASVLGGLVAAAGVGAAVHLPATALALVVVAAAFFPLLARDAANRPVSAASEEASAGARSFPSPVVIMLGLIGFSVLFGEGAMADWSAVYLRDLGTTEGVAAAGYALFSAAMAAGRFSGNKLTELLGAASLVRLGGLLAAMGLTVALISGWAPLALLGFGVVGLGFSVVFPLTLSAAGRSGKVPSSAIAFVSACGYGGFLLGPAVIGFFAELTVLGVALASVVVLSVLVAAVAGAIGERRELAEAQA
ncbi:MAG: MFS transporter [Rubrobacter sp.]|nr:MFS transporter [Rubrobacter sp.]